MREDRPANTKRGRTRVPLWRWRSNPVRRRDDVLEAWLVLVMWVLVAAGGTAAGVVTAHAADQVFARQRADRVPVRAVLLDDVPRPATSGLGGDLGSARVRWTNSDGSTHSGTTLVPTGTKAGSAVRIWIDGRQRPSTQPTPPAEAAVEAALFGGSAALALSGVVFGAGSAGRWWLDRRRIARWDREWTLVGPEWSHKTG
ncbi:MULTISPECIES: Rv1733c family protein [unclassified Streptomyces]|uniref:Rv1733c family protein n=1 Tax=unclassified Streptomyces TaxID=2593676 RepID=UPI0040427DFF